MPAEQLQPKKMEYITHSSDETFQLGQKIGNLLEAGSIVCFFGDLGAGKTTLIKGLVHTITDLSPEIVNSPTFQYLNIYQGKSTVYHFDLYRLQNSEDFLGMGFEEMFYQNGIVCLEWAERIQDMLPKRAWLIHIEHETGDSRKITVHSRN